MLKKICSVLTGVAMMFQITSMSGISEEISMEDFQIEESNLDVLDSSEYLAGDVNGDGAFSVADVVAIQKWLLNFPNTHLANWKAADFYADNQLNVFDLCLMKRKLIENVRIEIDEFIPCEYEINDVFVNYVVVVTMKKQYPKKNWTVADFKNVENIKEVQDATPPLENRQVLYVFLKDCSKENVLNMVYDIENLNFEEIYTVRPTSWETYD